MYSKLSCGKIRNCKRNAQNVSRIRILQVESEFCLRIPFMFADSIYILRNLLTDAESRITSYISCCGIRNKTNVPTRFTLQLFVRGIHENFVSGIHLLFGTCLKICLWNPGAYIHKVVRLSSAQFGPVREVLSSKNNNLVESCPN